MTSEQRRLNTANPDFYEYFAMPLEIPGTDTLRIKVMHDCVGTDYCMGEVLVDVEDRWQAVLQKELYMITDTAYMKRYLSNPGVTDDGRKIPAKLGPSRPFPIEFGILNKIDPISHMKTPSGSIRYWVDLVPIDDTYNVQDIGEAIRGVKLEIRVTIWDVTEVTIYKDTGMRNDLVVRGILIIRDIAGKVTRVTKDTDTHTFCNEHGIFNWKWKYQVHVMEVEISCIEDTHEINSNFRLQNRTLMDMSVFHCSVLSPAA